MALRADGATLASVGGGTVNLFWGNALDPANTNTTDGALSNVNRTYTGKSGGTNWAISRAVDGKTSGKYYFEAILTLGGTTQANTVGIVDGNQSIASGQYVGITADSIGMIDTAGTVFQNNHTAATVAALASGGTACVAVDIDNHAIWFRVGAGNWNNVAGANPATGTGPIQFSPTGTIYAAVTVFGNQTLNHWVVNFGNVAFVQTMPAGYAEWDGYYDPTQSTYHLINVAFAGVGTQTANPETVILDSAAFAGVGGWSININNERVATANWSGAGGWSINLNNEDAAAANWFGAGGWLIDVTDISPPLPISAEFDGVGGWIESDVQFDVINTEFDGVGSWSIDVDDVAPTIIGNFNGVGGWIESDVQFDAIVAAFAGVGGWSTSVINFPVLYPGVWQGSGGWAAWLASPRTQLYWRSTNSSFIILDATSGMVFNTPLRPEISPALIFNVGQPIPNDYTQFSLTLTRPDGSSYQPYWDFYAIGEQVFNPLGMVETPTFLVGQYLVYSFAQGELNQPGPWTATYQAGSRIVELSFTLPPFNMMRAA